MSASAILKLQAAGFTAAQVTALAELIDSQAASKADLLEVEHRLDMKIGELRAELVDVEHRLDAKIGDVEHRLDAKIGDVEHRLDAKLGELRAELVDVEHRLDAKIGDVKIEMIKWMIGVAFAQTGLILAVIKLFAH